MQHRHSATEEQLLSLPIEKACEITEKVIHQLNATTPNWGDDDYFAKVQELMAA